MASEPSSHLLLGGHNGAIKWLKRFLSMLPPKPQSPLPLITAPVLDAFLTGAGHMMSLKHTELFKEYLDTITNDICTRLDESSIGMPSATRLRKTIKNGMEGFRTTLPSKALPALYYGANGGPSNASGTGMASTNPSPFGTANVSQVPTRPLFGSSNSTVASSANSSVSSAFGSSNPFGSNSNATGGGPMASSSSPFESMNSNKKQFGSGPNTSQQSPFGGGAVSTTTSSSPFGAPSNFSSFPSSDTAGNQQQSPFGANFGSSPLTSGNSTPFGGSAPVAASPFGASSVSSMPGFHAPAPTTLPFGQPANNSLPFGGGNTLGSPTPFGSSQFASSQTTGSGFFGGGNPNTGSTPFGSSSTPFGSSSIAPSPTPFSNNIQQQPFGGGQSNPSSMSPFGGGLSSPPSSYGFGGGSAGGIGFGGVAPSHNNNNNNNNGNGNGRNNADTRPPCKFFARGACRNGANCNFSHATTTSNTNSDPYSSHQNTPFGGSSNNNNPFGGPRR